MKRFSSLICRRLVGAIPVILTVILVCYVLIELAPGDAVDSYLAVSGGDREFAASLRHMWGLEQGFAARLITYLARLITFDLGQSLIFSRPVLDVIAERFPNTLLLMGASIGLAFGVGTFFGLIAGSRPYSWYDRFLCLMASLLYAIPSFWFALVLIIVFSVKLSLLPVGGLESVSSDKQGMDHFIDIAQHLILPISALGLIYLGVYLRLMRSGMIEVWRLDFIRTARAKGLTQTQIILNHVARNALLPVVTMFGLQLGSMFGGSVVIESVFAIPGFGRLAYEAVTQRDLSLLMGVIIVSAISVIITNILVDLAYSWLDPRIGTERKIET
ncbi:MAG: ABC transporter permease [Alphaproteobacteria bacterium]